MLFKAHCAKVSGGHVVKTPHRSRVRLSLPITCSPSYIGIQLAQIFAMEDDGEADHICGTNPDGDANQTCAELLRICSSFRDDIRELLKKALELSQAISGEQFLSEVLTGKCPLCGSNRTGNGKDAEGMKDFTVGLCLQCGYLWCADCGGALQSHESCNHWSVCRSCGVQDDCGIAPAECTKLRKTR